MTKLLHLSQLDIDTGRETHYILDFGDNNAEGDQQNLGSFHSNFIQMIIQNGKMMCSPMQNIGECAYFYELIDKISHKVYRKMTRIQEVNLEIVKKTKNSIPFNPYHGPIYGYILNEPHNLVFIEEEDLKNYIYDNIEGNIDDIISQRVIAKFVNPVKFNICLTCFDFFDGSYSNICDNCHKSIDTINVTRPTKKAKTN